MRADVEAPRLDCAPRGLYIGGAWVPGTGDLTFETLNPSTAEKLADVPLAGEDDVNMRW